MAHGSASDLSYQTLNINGTTFHVQQRYEFIRSIGSGAYGVVIR